MKKKGYSLFCFVLISFALIKNPSGITFPHAQIGLHEPSEWNWYMTDVISESLDGWSTNPAVCSDSNGTMHAVWADDSDYQGAGTDADIFYTSGHFHDWNEIQVISNTTTSSASGKPIIAPDPWGNVHIAWMDTDPFNNSGTDSDILYRVVTYEKLHKITRVSETSHWESVNVSMVVDGQGMVHFAWADSTDYDGAGNDWDIFYRKYDPINDIWYPVTVISSQSTGNSLDPSIVVSLSKDIPGFWDVHIFWSDAAVFGEAISWDNIYHRSWTQTGGWGNTELISWESIYASLMPVACTGPTGNIHVAWFDENDRQDTEIFYKRYDTRFGNWTDVEAIGIEQSNTSSHCPPSIAVDSADVVHVSWIEEGDYAGSESDNDIVYRRLYTEINTWTTPEIVSGKYYDESTGDSSNPDIAVDPAGNILFVWDDLTNWDMDNDFDIFSNQFGSAPAAPVLSVLLPPPGHTSDSGTIELQWNTVVGATDYCVYRSKAFIRSDIYVDKTQVGWDDYGYLMDNLTEPGIYYYAVTAQNAHGVTYSNCIAVEYKVPSLAEFMIIASMVVGTTISIAIITYTRKNKAK